MKSLFFRLIVLIVALSGSLVAKDDVAIVCIFQNEAPWIKEWIEFHKLQGVKHFYLYNNNSDDNYMEVLQPYIEKDLVTLKDWKYTYDYADHGHWIAIQTGAYVDCIKHYGKEMDWLAAIDTDEFLYTTGGQKLGEFLKKYHNYGGIAVNWVKFGTSGVEDFEPNKLMIEVLTQCAKYNNHQNKFIKSIVQPKYVSDCRSPHCFRYVEGKYAVNADGEKVRSTRSEIIHLSKIRINHYWTRSKKYLLEEKIPSRQKRRDAWSTERILAMCAEFEIIKDTNILQFVEPLRKKMGFTEDK